MSSVLDISPGQQLGESSPFESCATYDSDQSGAVILPDGSIESRSPNPPVRMRRPRSYTSLVGEPETEEEVLHLPFAIGPTPDWTQPALEAALLGVLVQAQTASPVASFTAGVDRFWPQASGTRFCVTIPMHLDPKVIPVEREGPTVADEARFGALAARWRCDTLNISSTSRMAMHPAYQSIIGMGIVAVPLILGELQARPDWWFWALRAITGVDPVPVNRRGFLHDMAEAWLKWGRERGYLGT